VGHWSALLDRLGRAVGADREALATPGALLGLGIRDHAMAQCGNCSRGGLPLPFWGAVADHHAVTPGFVDSVGWRIVAGRDLLAADGAGAEPVALVNEAFAARAFEKGDPLGRKIRVGTALDRWYTVVGVVAHASNPVPGGADQRRAAVYLSALQAPPVHGRLVYRGDARTDRAVAGLLSAEGYAPGEPASLAEYRRRAAAPLAWTRWVALLLGTATLLLALHGAHLTAIQVTRRHARPLAVRRVLGASDLRVLAHVLQGAAAVGVGSAILAILLGSLFVALLRQSAAGVPPLGVGPYLLVAAVLVAVSTSAAAQAAREALAVGPGRALAGHRPGRAELPGARSGS